MAEKLFTLGEGIRILKTEVVDYTWSFDTRFSSKIYSSGKFRTIGDLEEEIGLEFYFNGGLTHQWFAETSDGYFLNSYTSAESSAGLRLFGAFGVAGDSEIQLQGESGSYYFRSGVNDSESTPVVDDLDGKDRKFRMISGTALSSSHLSFETLEVSKLTELYPQALVQSVSFRNNGGYTPGGLNEEGRLEYNWFSSPTNGYLDGYLKLKPLGEQTLLEANRTLLLRSDDVDYSDTITDSGNYGNVPHPVADIGNSFHTSVSPLFNSSLSLSGLQFTHSNDFNLVGNQYEFCFNIIPNTDFERSLWVEKKGSYEVEFLKEDENYFIQFNTIKDPSYPQNLWVQGHSTNSSQYLSIPYSPYFLNGTSQGSNTPFTLQFVAMVGDDNNQPIFRQSPLNGEDGDVHVMIDKVGGLKWKNGTSGDSEEFSGGVALSGDQFYHFALVYDGTTTRAYIDGSLVNTSDDAVTITLLDAIEIGHCFMSLDNATEVFLTTAKIAWLSLDKGIAKWIGSFNPPSSPSLETHTSLLLAMDQSSGAIIDSTPHAHDVNLVNGGLTTEAAKITILKGQIPDLSLNEWTEFRIRRTPGDESSVYCNCENITTLQKDPIIWKDSLQPLVLVPDLNESFLCEDFALIVNGNSPLRSPLATMYAPSRRRSITDKTSYKTSYDLTSELSPAVITPSSEDNVNVIANLTDGDPNTFWENDTTSLPVQHNDLIASVDIAFPERIDVDKLVVSVSGLDPARNPDCIHVHSILDDTKIPMGVFSGLTWTGDEETLELNPVTPVFNNGNMGQRVHPVVGKFMEDDHDEYMVVTAGTPSNHFGKLNLRTEKWETDTGIVHSRIGARGVAYTKASLQKVLGIWSGDTSDNNYYEIDATSGIPTLVSTSGVAPSAKIHYCVCHYVNVGGDNCLVVFGGYDGSSYTSALNELNLETMTWSTVGATGTAPSVRGNMTSAVYQNSGSESCMLVFGGTNGASWYNDVYELNLDTSNWTMLSPSGTPPIARESSPSNLIYKNDSNHDIFIIYGGTGSSGELDDFNELNLDAGSWSGVIPLTGNNPPGCRDSEGILYVTSNQKIKMTLVGGMNHGGMYNDKGDYSFYHPILNVTDREWEIKTPIAPEAPSDSDLIEFKNSGQTYLGWMYKGRYLFGMDINTGAIYEFNTDIHYKAWNSDYVEQFSTSVGQNKIGIYGGYVGGSASVPTTNFFEISLTDMSVSFISQSNDIHPAVGAHVHTYFINKDGLEQSLVYGGRNDLGTEMNTVTSITDAGVCTTVELTPDQGEISDEMLKSGLFFKNNGIPHLFLWGQVEDSLDYLDINLWRNTTRSGFMSTSDATVITESDRGALNNREIIFFDYGAPVRTYKKLNLITMNLETLSGVGDVDSSDYRIGSAGNKTRFISTGIGNDFYNELNDYVVTDTMISISSSTVHDSLQLQLINDHETVELSEIKIYSESPVCPFLSVDPSNDNKQDTRAITGLLHSDFRTITYSPSYCGVVDDDNALNNVGPVFIIPQDHNGIIVIDNTGNSSRRALVKIDVTDWTGGDYELTDSVASTIDYGFIQVDMSISSTPTDTIIMWVNLKANELNVLDIGVGAPASHLTSTDIYDVSTSNGDTQEWCMKHEALSYLPACTVSNGSIEDSIVVDNTYEIEINFAAPISPNFVIMMLQSTDSSTIVIEGDNGVDWDYLGTLIQEGEMVYGRIFCDTTYQKFRAVVEAKLENVMISGFDLLSLENGALSSSGQVIKTHNSKLWEITSSSTENINTYDQSLPCLCTGVVQIAGSTDMHLMLPPVEGASLFATVSNTPVAYPYNAMITTGDQTRLDANLSDIKSVGILASDDVRVAFSFDDRITWVAWTGAWTVVNASTPAQLASTGMTPAEVRSIPLEAWTPNLGIGEYIDSAISLSAADNLMTCYFDNITFEIEGGNNINTRFMTYGPDHNFAGFMKESTISYRDEAAITADGAFSKLRCGKVDTGLTDNNLELWVPPADGFLTKISGTSIDLNPGWVYVDDGLPPVSPFVGLGWFNERGTIRKIDLSNGTMFNLGEDTYTGNSEGGICFSNNQTGYTIGTCERGSTLGFMDKIDFATGVITRNRADLEATHSRGCASNTFETVIPPMDTFTMFQSIDFATDTKMTTTRINAASSGWEDQGSLSNIANGWFFNNSSTLKCYQYTFGTTTEEVVDRQDLSSFNSVKGFSVPNLDQGLMVAESTTSTDKLRLVNIDYANDTTHITHTSNLPLTSSIYNSSSTDRDSVHSRIGDNGRCLMYIYADSGSICLEIDFAIKMFFVSSRLNSDIAPSREGYKAAGNSGLGYIL